MRAYGHSPQSDKNGHLCLSENALYFVAERRDNACSINNRSTDPASILSAEKKHLLHLSETQLRVPLFCSHAKLGVRYMYDNSMTRIL